MRACYGHINRLSFVSMTMYDHYDNNATHLYNLTIIFRCSAILIECIMNEQAFVNYCTLVVTSLREM